MHDARKSLAMGCATSRSKISNGTRLHQNVDGRSSSARRFRDLLASLQVEIGGSLNEADQSLTRQAAMLLLKSEEMQAAAIRGEPIDSDQLIRLASTSKRILGVIAAKAAKRRPAGNALADYLSRSSA